MLAAFFAVCILASVTACKHTENTSTWPGTYEGVGKSGGNLLVPMIKWAF